MGYKLVNRLEIAPQQPLILKHASSCHFDGVDNRYY